MLDLVELKKLQEMLYKQYLRDEKDKIFAPHGNVGDIAELGLISGEEIGEAQMAIRKKNTKGDHGLEMECADILIRTLCFMSRKGIDAEKAIEKAHQKNVDRNRKGLYIKEGEE